MSLHYVGEVVSGGVVFHTYHVNSTEEECFILSLNDISVSYPWSNVNDEMISGTSIWDGKGNMDLIINQNNHTSSAALKCREYDDGNWYLPSIKEMQMISYVFWELNHALSQLQGADEIYPGEYWTSNEFNMYNAYFIDFISGSIQYSKSKLNNLRVRAIKKVPC